VAFECRGTLGVVVGFALGVSLSVSLFAGEVDRFFSTPEGLQACRELIAGERR